MSDLTLRLLNHISETKSSREGFTRINPRKFLRQKFLNPRSQIIKLSWVELKAIVFLIS